MRIETSWERATGERERALETPRDIASEPSNGKQRDQPYGKGQVGNGSTCRGWMLVLLVPSRIAIGLSTRGMVCFQIFSTSLRISSVIWTRFIDSRQGMILFGDAQHQQQPLKCHRALIPDPLNTPTLMRKSNICMCVTV